MLTLRELAISLFVAPFATIGQTQYVLMPAERLGQDLAVEHHHFLLTGGLTKSSLAARFFAVPFVLAKTLYPPPMKAPKGRATDAGDPLYGP